jgi:hypothetical protein
MTGLERRCQVSDLSDSVEFLSENGGALLGPGMAGASKLAPALIYHFTNPRQRCERAMIKPKERA